ncbi:MAG TPA: hypothetical protein VF373_12555 [Prolixibacteraceae bacterium]
MNSLVSCISLFYCKTKPNGYTFVQTGENLSLQVDNKITNTVGEWRRYGRKRNLLMVSFWIKITSESVPVWHMIN